MSDTKCPFCGKPLLACIYNQNDVIYCCDNQDCVYHDDADNPKAKHYLGTAEFWQALTDSQERYKDLSAAFKKQIEVNELLTDESNKFLNKLNNIRDLVKNWYGVVDDDMYDKLKKELDLDKYDSENDEKAMWVACPKDDTGFIWTSGATENEVIDNLIKHDYDVEKYIIKKIKI